MYLVFSFILVIAWLSMFAPGPPYPDMLLAIMYLVALVLLWLTVELELILDEFWNKYFLLPLFSFLNFSFSRSSWSFLVDNLSMVSVISDFWLMRLSLSSCHLALSFSNSNIRAALLFSDSLAFCSYSVSFSLYVSFSLSSYLWYSCTLRSLSFFTSSNSACSFLSFSVIS